MLSGHNHEYSLHNPGDSGNNFTIDYVYCTRKMYERIVDAYTVVDDWTLCKPSKDVKSLHDPSDHRPIYVEFQF